MTNYPTITVRIEPFTFPNFLRVAEWKDHTYPVHMLSDEQALAYWDELRDMWLSHVREKRRANEAWLKNEANLRNLAMKATP